MQGNGPNDVTSGPAPTEDRASLGLRRSLELQGRPGHSKKESKGPIKSDKVDEIDSSSLRSNSGERVRKSGEQVGCERVAEPNPTQDAEPNDNKLTRQSSGPPYTILSERLKIFTILLASFTGFISPVSGAIYFPAINSLARDLNVSVSLINLTITTYMIFQGIAPSLIGSLADTRGRRPAYLVCLTLYIAANLGLALQTSYPALLVLRCLQSSGSSGTVILAVAVVTDVVTRAERGRYVAYSSLGVTLGPALGPLIGGLLSQFTGWRGIFWFLVIYAGVMILLVGALMPETCRSVVGNGSIPVKGLNKSLLGWWIEKRKIKEGSEHVETETISSKPKRPNPIASLKIMLNKEEASIQLMGSLLFAGFYAVISTLAPILKDSYGYNDLEIGACYIPYGFGSIVARQVVGRTVDWNFARHAKKLGMEIKKNRQQDISRFPIEKVRLQIALPMIYLGCGAITAYAWVLEIEAPIAAPLVCLFFVGLLVSGSFSIMNMLVVDINHENPATAMAAINLMRCLFGAGAVAVSVPLIERIGIGWTGTFVAGLWVAASPLLWVVLRYGMSWRQQKAGKEKEMDERADPEE